MRRFFPGQKLPRETFRCEPPQHNTKLVLYSCARSKKGLSVLIPYWEINFKSPLGHQMYLLVEFYPWFKFHFLFFQGMIMYDNVC